MSLPFPGTAGGRRPQPLSPKEQDVLDAPLMALAQKSGGDLRQLMYSFFSFLHRRTDFYMVPNDLDVQDNIPLKMGFREGDAEKLLLAAFRQFPLRRMPRMTNANSDAIKTNDSEKATSKNKDVAAPTEEKSKITTKEQEAGAETQKNEKVSSADNPSSDCEEKGNNFKKDAIRYSEDGKQIPVGNGGTCLSKGFRWTQTIHESSIAISVPKNTRGKDLKVSIKSNNVQVQMKESSEILLEGQLKEKIRPDESTWTLEDSVLLLTLDKYTKTWWDLVFVDEEKKDTIDTSLIDTKRNISEYDNATQGMIRKILFDQHQERLGLPSSDEILGEAPKVPPLPDGVEYFDKRTNFPPDKI